MNETELAPLSAEQDAAAKDIWQFMHTPSVNRPYYVLHGLAGTGKTHLLSHIARENLRAGICTLTGKAASVLTRRTGLHVTTIHSWIYRFVGLNHEGNPMFIQGVDDGDWTGNVALLDESSMVGQRIADDLLATGCRVVACGDPGQLPPVRDAAFFNDPDFTLREIHRQALTSPIIRQAHAVRRGDRYSADGPDFRVTSHVSADDIHAADIIICWRNRTRMAINELKRAHLGLAGKPPQAGEPMMALRNNHKVGVLNGAIYELQQDHVAGRGRLCVKNERGEIKWVPNASVENFDEPPPEYADSKIPPVPFAYAYASTCHKAQGSEFDRIIIVDEMDRTREEYPNFLYTAITRARQSVLMHTAFL